MAQLDARIYHITLARTGTFLDNQYDGMCETLAWSGAKSYLMLLREQFHTRAYAASSCRTVACTRRLYYNSFTYLTATATCRHSRVKVAKYSTQGCYCAGLGPLISHP